MNRYAVQERSHAGGYDHWAHAVGAQAQLHKTRESAQNELTHLLARFHADEKARCSSLEGMFTGERPRQAPGYRVVRVPGNED